jgi:hypothetical protein
MEQGVGLALLALAIVGHAFAVWLRSPKEISNAIEKRLSDVEHDHELLARGFATHDEAMKGLGKSIDNLTHEVRSLRDAIGRQPDVRRR